MNAALDVFRVLFDPAAVFARLREKPRILVPFVVIAVAYALISLVLLPFQAAAMEGLRATLPPEQAARMGDSPGGGAMGILFVPVVVFLMLAVGAGLLWVTASVTAAEARYRALLSVLTHTFVTFVLFAALGALVLTLRGVESVTSMADMRAPLGLDLVVPGAKGYLAVFLNGINPLSIWGVWLTGTGISITHNTARGSAIAAAAVAFLVGLAVISIQGIFTG